MKSRSRRIATATAAALAVGCLSISAPGAAQAQGSGASADASPQAAATTTTTTTAASSSTKTKDAKYKKSIQLLSFNDYHGHVASPDVASPSTFFGATNVGGGEYLATMLKQLRAEAPKGRSLTVAAGDLIGGSPFLSGLFHDEPSVETLNAMDLDLSSVGNHEFDEGTAELLRMQKGGCHPKDGCYFPKKKYKGADFKWLAANVVKKSNGHTLLPGTSIKKIDGVKVGFIGMTLKETPTLVSPAGVATVNFLDEVTTANAEAKKLRKQGVKAIVVLLHEGGIPTSGGVSDCNGVSTPISTIQAAMDPSIDMLVTGHTHQAYVCSMTDPAGKPRLVTSAGSYGRVVTETNLVIDRRTGDVDRTATAAENHLVAGVAADPKVTSIVAKWNAIAAPLAGRVVGTVAEDITGDANGNRGIETPMADVVADAILASTDGADEGGAQIAFMNVGGVRASLLYNTITNGEKPGEVTYAEGYAVNPFGNLIVSVDMTGADIKAALEQQYVPTRSRKYLALGVSKGFTYTWDDAQAQGSKVVAGSMKLNGVAIEANQTYRVAMYSFLAEGGDSFSAFKNGTKLLGGPEDLAAFVAYLGANPGLTAPASRVEGL